MSLWRIVLVLIGLAGLLAAPAFARAPARLALIIDQTNYTGDLSRVALAKSEADSIDKALITTGFRITRKSDLTKSGLEDALGEFRAALEASGPDTIAFVYYTGHGLQHPQSGDSYLLGIDARLKSASDLAVYGLDLASQRDGFAATGAQAIFLVFDACRNVPALPGFKGNKKGMSRIEAEPDMLIAYSTRLNDVAEEGVYAPILAEELARPGQTAETAFTAAQRRVQQTTARKQRPYTDMDLSNEVCFAGCTLPAGASLTAARTTTLPPPALRKGDTFRDKLKDGTEGPEMVVIPAGDFSMGSSILEAGREMDEGMVRTVRIPRNFGVGVYEVTNAEFGRCVAAGACGWFSKVDFAPGASNQPATMVSRLAARQFSEWLTAQTGQRYRLLSEAEWEYAARAGTTGRYHNGGEENSLCDIANFADKGGPPRFADSSLCWDGARYAAAVGSYKPNAFGLYDMHGNAMEWVEDCYAPNYTGAPSDGSARNACPGNSFVLRGGDFNSPAAEVRSAHRGSLPAEDSSSGIGFRIARDLD